MSHSVPSTGSEQFTTLRAQLDRALRDAEAARADKARFLAVMNHEFRTPMNGVLGVAELLRRRLIGAESHALLDTIVGSAETLQRMMEDALDLAQRDTGPARLSDDTVNPAELLDQVAQGAAGLAADCGVRLLASFIGDPDLRVTADARRLKQVLGAFVEHAVHRQERGGVVEFRLGASATDGGVTLRCTVRDRGHMPTPAALARTFEPFGEDDGSGFAGRGLRLVLARRNAEAMGGAVWAEANVGPGMSLGLDVRLSRAAEARAPAYDGLARDGRAPRVLIVDDNATNRMVATAFCEMAGCVCEQAEDGLAAVEAVATRAFDVVLMDIKMPRLDGVGAARAIRALPGAAGAVPMIALTANADPEATREYAAAGMPRTVEKPIKPEHLLAALAAALESGSDARAIAA